MRRQQLLANNAVSRLASSITNTALSLSVLPGQGARFPSPTGGKYFRATIIKSDGTKEVIKVTARSTDTFTIQRAIEPVAGVQTAYAFSAGDKVELRVTSGLLEEEFNRLDAGLIEPLNKSASYTVTTGDASSLVRVNTGAGAVTIMLPSIASLPYDFDIIIAKVSSDGNVVTVDADGSDTINGAGTYNIGSQWQSVWLIADKTTNTWTAINSGANVGNAIVDTFVGAGSPGPFTLSQNPGSLNNIAVFVGGTWQKKATMLLSGTSLTLGGAVPSGVVVEVAYNVASIIEIGSPSDASVTTPKLASSAVTADKLDANAIGLKTNGLSSKATPVDADEMPLADSAASFGTKKLTWANLKAALKAYFDRVSPSVPVRQTVLSGPVDSSGFPSFGGSTGSTTVTAVGTLVAAAANGFSAAGKVDRVGTSTNPSWTGLSTNGTMYLYLDIAADGTCTTGSTTLAPIYQWGGAYSTTNGQNTYNIQEAVMQVGNGSTASQVYRVFVGEVTVSGGVVTAITWYALMGRYDSGLIATLTGTGTNISANHNLGVTPAPNNFGLAIECVVAELGYAVGDRIMGPHTGYNGTYEEPILTWSNTKTIGFSTNNSVNWRVASRFSPGTLVNTTASNWKYRLFANRGW